MATRATTTILHAGTYNPPAPATEVARASSVLVPGGSIKRTQITHDAADSVPAPPQGQESQEYERVVTQLGVTESNRQVTAEKMRNAITTVANRRQQYLALTTNTERQNMILSDFDDVYHYFEGILRVLLSEHGAEV